VTARVTPDSLAKTWLHSHEEDTAGSQVFRPSDFPFPPARGRDALTLNPDGSLQRSGAGPDDRRRNLSGGSWKVQGDNLHVDFGDGSRRSYVIEEAQPDKLQLRPL
jgi:hypothetical protein